MEFDEAIPDGFAEDFIIALIGEYFGNIAALDEKTMRENVVLGCENGFSEEDRSVRTELVDYLFDNFSVIYLGLLVNDDFRGSFKKAVDLELDLADKSKSYIRDVRQQLKDGPVLPSKGNVVIDLSKFDLAQAKDISMKIRSSMDKIAPFSDEFNSIVQEVTDSDAAAIGFCISNFMFLIRAFDKNPAFENYVRSIVKAVGTNLGIA
ncbi:MAG: hypothetical protein II820_00560 [Ruminiclostridium sp.]|nr:hypothetical protein [Ruminiclostridium sp.]